MAELLSDTKVAIVADGDLRAAHANCPLRTSEELGHVAGGQPVTVPGVNLEGTNMETAGKKQTPTFEANVVCVERLPVSGVRMTLLRRVLLTVMFGVWVGMVLGCGGGSSSNPAGKKGERLSVELVKARLEPFRDAKGADTQIVAVDWKNTSNRPVRLVRANIKVFDAQGKELYSAPDYTIYAVFNDKPGVAPGETYTKPKGEGHIIPPLLSEQAVRATVVITWAEEKGME